jgi:CMP-N,N'-diacetyllegionaminic acid synthase
LLRGGRVLGLIPARGSSKGVPRKNLRMLGDKPLLHWTVEAARGSRHVDRLVLSTDDDEIAEVGESLGIDVPFRRPARFATDGATADAVVLHAIGTLSDRFAYVVYLQPTSPFRSSSDIDGCLERLASRDADACVSVRIVSERPEWMYYLADNDRLTPLTDRFEVAPRQDLRSCYLLNGAVYAGRVDAFLRNGSFLTEGTLGYVMPPERSLDLDEPADFDKAEAMLRRHDIDPA